jgi:hypothetical protein
VGSRSPEVLAEEIYRRCVEGALLL